MRAVPNWLSDAGLAFELLPVARQRAVMARVADELEERTRRLRDRIRSEDLAAFDAAATGIVGRARQLTESMTPGTEPRGRLALVNVALDNRGVSVLEPIAMQAVREARKALGPVEAASTGMLKKNCSPAWGESRRLPPTEAQSMSTGVVVRGAQPARRRSKRMRGSQRFMRVGCTFVCKDVLVSFYIRIRK